MSGSSSHVAANMTGPTTSPVIPAQIPATHERGLFRGIDDSRRAMVSERPTFAFSGRRRRFDGMTSWASIPFPVPKVDGNNDQEQANADEDKFHNSARFARYHAIEGALRAGCAWIEKPSRSTPEYRLGGRVAVLPVSAALALILLASCAPWRAARTATCGGLRSAMASPMIRSSPPTSPRRRRAGPGMTPMCQHIAQHLPTARRAGLRWLPLARPAGAACADRAQWWPWRRSP
jgi:hypothetical protein